MTVTKQESLTLEQIEELEDLGSDDTEQGHAWCPRCHPGMRDQAEGTFYTSVCGKRIMLRFVRPPRPRCPRCNTVAYCPSCGLRFRSS